MNRIWLLIVLVLGVFLYFMYKKQNIPQEVEHVEQMIQDTKETAEEKAASAPEAALDKAEDIKNEVKANTNDTAIEAEDKSK
jgi:predicted Holliday junction resolvase-like endonuclease